MSSCKIPAPSHDFVVRNGAVQFAGVEILNAGDDVVAYVLAATLNDALERARACIRSPRPPVDSIVWA